QRLEGLVEGFFARVFRSGLQPIEVGRKILREMADGKTLSVNKVYAPNEFRVVMGTDDYSRFSQMEAALRKEFTDLVIDNAKQNRWNLMGLPEITFEEQEGFGKGEFRVEASFAASEQEPRHVATKAPDEQNPSSTGAISTDAATRLGLATSATPQLVLLDERGKPSEKISVTREPVVIGRMSNNDVVLPDANVSRRHAELKKRDDRWVLVDLGSTNGTTVNGKLAGEHELKDGDRLGFGTSQLIFRSGEGD
ncbi:MAG: FhaA domain-containing protein, partial [Actinomycetota bacterium]